jgi:hypothetical protein
MRVQVSMGVKFKVVVFWCVKQYGLVDGYECLDKSAASSTQKVEEVGFSEMFVLVYHITCSHVLEDCCHSTECNCHMLS